MQQKVNLYKLLAQRWKRKEKYFANYLFYLKMIKERALELLGDAEVFVFGSVVKKDYSPGSDIDVLIVSGKIPENLFEQSRIKYQLLKDFVNSPFEIHLVTPLLYENWYKNFIKEDYKKV